MVEKQARKSEKVVQIEQRSPEEHLHDFLTM